MYGWNLVVRPPDTDNFLGQERDMPPAIARKTADSRIEYIDLSPAGDRFLDDVIEGLTSVPKTLPCKYFYDEKGSVLFEQITQLPEYYPTRTEIAIMERFVGEMVGRFSEGVRLVEPGSGASVKTRILLREALNRGIQVRYVPIDISREFVFSSARTLASVFPGLTVQAVCADYTQGITWLGNTGDNRQTVYYFPGSTIGNFTTEEARAFMSSIRRTLRPGDGFLLGTDMKKDTSILHAAYNDATGITAQFNKHLLERVRDELGATIPVHEYDHEAVYNTRDGRIEMYLHSRSAHTISIDGNAIPIGRGESILTEYSHKFDPEQVRLLARASGFELEESWTDDAGLFAVHWLAVQ